MPNVPVNDVYKAVWRRYNTTWVGDRELRKLGVTKKQIIRFRQSTKSLSCSMKTAKLIKMYCTADRTHFHTLEKVIEAQYGV